MRKKLAVIIILLTLATAPFLIKHFFFKKKDKFALTTVKRGNLVNKISTSGLIKAEKEVNLKFQTSGTLSWVGVKEGDYVKQWQVIAQLDARELQKNLEKALRDYSKERWDFEQEREDQNITIDDLDKYTLSNEARRILEENQFDLEKAILDVELKDIALQYATLITPISGIVTYVDTPVAGINITPATAVFTIADPTEVFFEANVDEVDIAQIKEEQRAILTLDAYQEEEIEGEVAQIGFQSKTTKGGGTVFPVKIELPENKDLKFKLGMNGDAEIILEERKDVLVIPFSAIIERKENRFVWAVEEGRAKKREVKIGLETEEKVEILEGVKEGEKIISEGISKIKEGEKVQ